MPVTAARVLMLLSGSVAVPPPGCKCTHRENRSHHARRKRCTDEPHARFSHGSNPPSFVVFSAKKGYTKTEEERREEAIKEANGTEDSEGMLSEILDEQLDTISDDNGTDTLVISGKGMEYCKQLYAAESENQTEEADAENLRLKSMQK